MLRLIIALLVINFNFGLCYAANTIKLTVQTSSSEVAAIGLTYDGHKAGGLGKYYSSSGFKAGFFYHFGYRKSMFGQNYACGSSFLDKDSVIDLIIDAKGCIPEIH